MLSNINNGFFLHRCAVCVTIFSTGNRRETLIMAPQQMLNWTKYCCYVHCKRTLYSLYRAFITLIPYTKVELLSWCTVAMSLAVY